MSVRRLLSWYAKGIATGSSGVDWYRDASLTASGLSRSYRVSRATACGVIAALSPRMQWAVNVRAASRVLAALRSGAVAPPSVGMSRFVALAWRIANGEQPLRVLQGPKVRSFYRNLMGDLSHVTVDVWALRALGWPGYGMVRGSTGYKGLTTSEYAKASAQYRTAAVEAGVAPAVFQAVVWTAIRGRAS